MFLDDPGSFCGGDVGIFQTEVVGVGDFAGVAFAAVIFVIPDQTGIGIGDVSLGCLIFQAVFRGVTL